MKIFNLIPLISLITLFQFCQPETQKADLIITNANIWTGNEHQPRAQALAVSGDTILGIGNDLDMEKYTSSSTIVVDADGKFITPGFIDSHVHLMSGGSSLLSIDLRDAKTPEEFTQRIAEYARGLAPGVWILEGNWDHTLWGGELPRKEWIDEFTKENPVVISRLDGHMVLANSLALDLASISESTPDVSGGEIVRNKDGFPTGILKDNAMDLLWGDIPALTETQKKTAFTSAMQYLVSHGVTSIHDMNGLSSNWGSYHYAQMARDEGDLLIRIYAMQSLSQWKQLEQQIANEGAGDKWLKIGGLKGFIDGSLGSHTAAFKEPYSDKPEDLGLFINTQEDIYQLVSAADSAGLQLLIHAIGDSAVQTLLNIYDRVSEENATKNTRHRIEHAQHIAPEDFDRFKSTSVIPSVQPYHAIDDGRWAEGLIGSERIKTTHPYRTFLDNQAVLAFGSDWPVAPATPLEGIYAAVTRRTLDDKNPDGWVPEQKISVEEALLAYTKYAAYASFEEDIKGTLEPGKLADFVVISEDITKVDPIRIRDLQVLETYVGGKQVFDILE
ncbi:amidohydrolase [bacterium]|nr:amidohydrolase [bacterium]